MQRTHLLQTMLRVNQVMNGGRCSRMGRVRGRVLAESSPVLFTPPPPHPHTITINPLHTASSTFTTQEKEIDKWLFPADDKVLEFMTRVRNGFNTMACSITINSDRVLDSSIVEEALTYGCSKINSMRTCFRPRDEAMWLAEMADPAIDFKVIDITDLYDELAKFSMEPFNEHDGPLWKFRLCRNASSDITDPVEQGYPHQYHLLVSSHHAISDLVSLQNVSQSILNIMDDIIEGHPVDKLPLGQLRDRTELRQAMEVVKSNLEKDPEKLRGLLLERSTLDHTPLITLAFGTTNESNPKTCKMDPFLIPPSVLDVLIKHCQSHGVTLNSFFQVLINTALVEVVKEAGLEKDHYTIYVRQPTDCRRFIKERGTWLGVHAMPLLNYVITHHNVGDELWKDVKQINVKMHQQLKEHKMLTDGVLDIMSRPQDYSHTKHYSNVLPNTYDYLFINIYNPQVQNTLRGKHIQVKDIQHYHSLCKQNCGIVFGLFGRNNQAQLQFLYSTGRITHQNARKIMNKLVEMLHDITNNVHSKL